MIGRRSFITSLSLIPFTHVPTDALPNISTKSIRDRLEYHLKVLDYTDKDFRDCRFIMNTHQYGWIWASPITVIERILDNNDNLWQIKLATDHVQIKKRTNVFELQFVDKYGARPYPPREYVLNLEENDSLMLTYRITTELT